MPGETDEAVREAEGPFQQPCEGAPLVHGNDTRDRDKEDRYGDADQVERRALTLSDHDTGGRQQSQPEGGEDKGGQKCPGGQRLRSPETAELSEAEGTRHERTGRERARDRPGRERDRREPARPSKHTTAAQEALIEAGERDERERLDRDREEQPPDVEMGELRGSTGQFAPLTAHSPQRQGPKTDANDEPETLPGPPMPRRSRLLGGKLAQGTALKLE